MRKLIERFLLSPIHPILFSIYFVLREYAFNISGVPPQDFLRPLFISVLVGAIFYLVFRLISHSWQVAAFMTSAALFMFFVYGLVWGVFVSQKIFIQPALLGGIWGLISLLFLAWIGLKGQKLINNDLILGLNLTTMILLLFPVIQVVRYSFTNNMPFILKADHTASFDVSPLAPDIYYIILDEYGRTDALKNVYGYDNSAFIQALHDMGFYVAECSQSNYANTALSLSSSLNLDYLQNLSDVFSPEEKDLSYLFKMLQNNAVRKSLSGAGYKTVVFASGFYWAEWRDADAFISPPDGPVTEFETVVLFSSYARLLDDLGIINFDDLHGDRFRQRTKLVLKSFDNLVDIPGPKFVFIHVIAPHEPHAFDENGNPVAPDQVGSDKGYINQAAFIGKAILPGLQTLIKGSKIPPVIILQGDHGPKMDNPDVRMRILNTYYLPQGADQLYPSISPVNSFRIVFNSYFGTTFPLLDDVSYYSRVSKSYDFTIVPNTCQN